MPALGKRLRELRKAKGRESGRDVTCEEVANAVGVSASSMYMYERGERKPLSDTLAALADYYEVSIDDLWGRAEKPIHAISRDMPLDPPGWEYLTDEERKEAKERTKEFELFHIRRILKEKGHDV